MRNIAIYYSFILAPLAILLWLNAYGKIEGSLFVICLLFYAIIYRTYTDGKRLVDKHIISKNDIWKMIIPGRRLKYFRELYWI
jgi:hypothetical protein